MENDTRLLQPVNIGMSSFETGSERFRKHSVFNPPATYHWRNNLTALSQRYNLYFVATGAYIAVYAPSFPFQKLGSLPALSIPPTVANPAAEGYIDTENPHAVNHLLVGDLGTAEVLVVCTDSGNVAAYHTRPIQAAIKARPLESEETPSTNYIGVRAFFSQWVQESAWGLAIHKHARMIAVSANTPHNEPSEDNCAKIHVFAFALSRRRSSCEDDNREELAENDGQSEWYLWDPDQLESNQVDRKLNYKVVLAGSHGHLNNIPNVSFVQAADDRHGNWLLSTGIDGEMKAWRIWQGQCHKTWNFSDRPTGTLIPWRQRGVEMGWNVAALDPSAFRTVNNPEEFCGWTKILQYHGYKAVGRSYDITNIVRSRLPGNSQFHPLVRDMPEPSLDEGSIEFGEVDFDGLSEDEQPASGEVLMAGLSLDPLRAEGQERTESLHSQTATGGESYGAESRLPSPGRRGLPVRSPDADEFQILERREDSGHTAQTQDDSDDESEILRSEDDQMNTQSTPSTASSSDRLLRPHTWSVGLQQDRDLLFTTAANGRNPSSRELFIQQSHRQHSSQSYDWLTAHTRSKKRGTSDSCSDIPCVPILHCSTSHIRMLDNLSAETPHIFCAQILKQLLPPAIEQSGYAQLDRLNMLQQIPELGIIIIASQIGRCAVCSLTRRGSDGDFGLRVDWVLPDRKQERENQRPIAPLLGIAVGPVQGRMIRGKAEMTASMYQGLVQDRIIDGVPTSFDPNMVLLSKPVLEKEGVISSHKNLTKHSKSREGKRKRSASHSSTAGDRATASHLIEQPPWLRNEHFESWRYRENSRRYRIMLTYTDQTVLTYEISREFEEVGIGTNGGGARKNLRNRDVF